MTLAFWCVLAAGVLPVLCACLAKWGGKQFDNSAPRDWLEGQTGWRKRADWAQRNSLEAFPLFAAGVVIAHLARGPQVWADTLAVAFVLLRLLYIAAYVLDQPTLRSALFAGGWLCSIAIYLIAA